MTIMLTSDSWVARAIYRLSSDMQNIEKSVRPSTFTDDSLFFISLCEFFSDNGFFTDRQIAIARRKLRGPYAEYLADIANS
jgi:hypothetical protein